MLITTILSEYWKRNKKDREWEREYFDCTLTWLFVFACIVLLHVCGYLCLPALYFYMYVAICVWLYRTLTWLYVFACSVSERETYTHTQQQRKDYSHIPLCFWSVIFRTNLIKGMVMFLHYAYNYHPVISHLPWTCQPFFPIMLCTQYGCWSFFCLFHPCFQFHIPF